MSKTTANSLLNNIEHKFHLVQDAEGAEMVYMLRKRISEIRAEITELKRRLTAMEKDAPWKSGGGGQRETENRPVLPHDDLP